MTFHRFANITKKSSEEFNIHGCEISDIHIFPNGTLNPNNEVTLYIQDTSHWTKLPGFRGDSSDVLNHIPPYDLNRPIWFGDHTGRKLTVEIIQVPGDDELRFDIYFDGVSPYWLSARSDKWLTCEKSKVTNDNIFSWVRGSRCDRWCIPGVQASLEEDYLLRKHLYIMVEAMSEIMATANGMSQQPIKTIIKGCIDEVEELYRNNR